MKIRSFQTMEAEKLRSLFVINVISEVFGKCIQVINIIGEMLRKNKSLFKNIDDWKNDNLLSDLFWM